MTISDCVDVRKIQASVTSVANNKQREHYEVNYEKGKMLQCHSTLANFYFFSKKVDAR